MLAAPTDSESSQSLIDEAIAVIKNGLGKAELEFVGSLVTPIFWIFRNSRTGQELVKNGSLFLVDAGEGAFAVTAAHVVSECLNDTKSPMFVQCMIGRQDQVAFPIHIGDRIIDAHTDTVAFIRSLLARAKKRVAFVDPYFNHIDVREFAVATQYQDVEVHALIGRGDPLWSRPSAAARDGSVAGDLFAEDLRALEERLKAAGRQLPGVRLMGDTARTYHDRFLVIDDDVWHFGHSFNQVGEGDVSMATRLRYPDSIRDLIVEDVERAALFIEAWPALRATRQQARKTLCARVAAWVARLCAWAASLQGGERGVENARPRESEAAL